MLLHVVKPPHPIDLPTHAFSLRSLAEEVRDFVSFVNSFEDLDACDGPEIRRLPTGGRIKGRPVKINYETVWRGFRTKDTSLKFGQVAIGIIEPLGFCHVFQIG
jgi:hypothetical protein